MKFQKLLTWLSILGLTIVLGCSSFQDVLTPCYIPPGSIDYADTNATTLLPYTTVFDARRVGFKMDFIHAVNQTTDKMRYNYLKGMNSFHITAAEELQAKIFSPEGPIGLLFPTLMGGTLGALLISKPNDKKKIIELEKTNGNSH